MKEDNWNKKMDKARLSLGEKTLLRSLRPLSEWMKRIPSGERSKIGVLSLMLIIGVGLIFFGGVHNDLRNEETTLVKDESVATIGTQSDSAIWSEKRVENELLSALVRIKGVGRVKVDLTYSESAEEEWLFRINEEERINQNENGGADREWRIEKEPVLRRQREGLEEPIQVKTIAPKIAGVLIIAEGTEDPIIKERVWMATSIVLGIPMHRVMVVPWGE